jgi:hypothetical protein
MHVLLMSPVQPSEKMKAIWAAHNPATELLWLQMLPLGLQMIPLPSNAATRTDTENARILTGTSRNSRCQAFI